MRRNYQQHYVALDFVWLKLLYKEWLGNHTELKKNIDTLSLGLDSMRRILFSG